MKLHEYQSKALLAGREIPIPRGEVADSAEGAAEVTRRLGGPVVVKAQVLTGGRGKAGGVRLAASPAEAGERAAEILDLKIRGLPVSRVLVEEASQINRELYLGLVVDRSLGRVVLMASADGGVEIEEVAHRNPTGICRLAIDPLIGLREFQIRYLAGFLGLPAEVHSALGGIVQGLYAVFTTCDASLAEINPLVLTRNSQLVALDAKIDLDDNALYRHPELERLRNADEESATEAQARVAGLSYVALEGNIGCMVNGAGLAMATLDAVKAFGGLPANFLDIGGGARAERVSTALGIILAEPRVRVVLLNVFGGITRCDEVARGVAEAIQRLQPQVPVVARLVGTNEAEGQAALAQVPGIQAMGSLSEAARLAVTLARGG